MTEPLLSCRALFVDYRENQRTVEAVRGVSLEILGGETLALVGESGSGKSTLARAIMLLVPARSGTILHEGTHLLDARGRPRLKGTALRAFRRRVQIVFQDPGSSLDPRMLVSDLVSEGLAIHDVVPKSQRRRRSEELLRDVGLASAHLARFPHELSGGQKQRLALARALAVEPDLLILDEPTAALDAEVAQQMLQLLDALKEKLGLAYLFISHDFGVVRQVADRIAVMRHGEIVENSSNADLYADPQHPYTRALLRAAAGDRAWVDDADLEGKEFE